MTPKSIWSAFTLALLSLLILPETTISIYHPDNKVEDHEQFQVKFPRFDSKKFKTPALFGTTSPSVFQTTSLPPSTYSFTSEQSTTSTYQSFEDFVSRATVSSVTNGKLLIFFASFAQKKSGWKKYLEHHIKCDDTPTQPPLSTKSPSSLPLVSYIPSFKPTNLVNAPTLDPSISNFPSSSTLPSSLPFTTHHPSNEVSNHTLEWKIETYDIDRVFKTKDQIVKRFEAFLEHILRCKNLRIKHIKLIRDKKENELYMKGVCFGSRKICNINLSEDDCNDNSLIDDFVAQRMLDISSSFDIEIDLSVSFDFNSDNIEVVPDFLSEMINGTSGARNAVANSNGPENVKVNNEATLKIKKDAAKSNFQNEATFQQHAIEVEEVIFLSTEDFSITAFTSADDTTKDSLYYGTPKKKCGSKCVNETLLVQKIFTFYDVDFNDTIDACFWDDINCIDDSVTQIFLRKFLHHYYCHF